MRDASPQKWSWDTPERSLNMSMTLTPSPTPDRDYFLDPAYQQGSSSLQTSGRRIRARSCHDSSGHHGTFYSPSPVPAYKAKSAPRRKTRRQHTYTPMYTPLQSDSDTTMPAKLPRDPKPKIDKTPSKNDQGKVANEEKAGGDAQVPQDGKETGQGVEKRRSCPPAIGTHKALMDQEELKLLIELKTKNTQLENFLKGTKEGIRSLESN